MTGKSSVIIGSNIYANVISEILANSIPPFYGQFHALVRYRADIAQDGRETSYLLYGNIQQEVVGLLVVSIQRHCQTVLEEARAQSDVI